MNDHYQLTNLEFATQFADCTLDPRLFSHEAHLRLAWIYVRKYGVDRAAEHLCTQIAQFDRTFGDGTKFHRTVTVASAKVIHHFVQKSGSDNFKDFIREFPRLKTHFRELLGFHYGFDIFNNEQAKRVYLEPDLLPF